MCVLCNWNCDRGVAGRGPEATREIRASPVSNVLGVGGWLHECPLAVMFVSLGAHGDSVHSSYESA